MTLPNLITGLRIILTPILAIYLIREDFPGALIVFVIAGLSDGADGLIARVFHQKSRLGACLDPLADKLLSVTAFITLSVRHYIPFWLTAMVISRDVLILSGVLILLMNRMEVTIHPTILSKATTCLQLGTIFVVLSRGYFPLLSHLKNHVFWLTGFFTIASGLHYMHYWFRVMGKCNAEE